MKWLEYGRAICYSGYRTGQSPRTGVYPSYEEVTEDLRILVNEGFKYIRMYEPTTHAKLVLRALREEHIPLKLMLGIDPRREINNPGCAWAKDELNASQLSGNAIYNDRQLQELIVLANAYQDEVAAVSVGNENRPSWGSDLLPKERLIEFARRLKAYCIQPVTYNEGTGEWLELPELVEELDIVSLHSYPLWNRKQLSEALDMNKADYEKISKRYPEKDIIFTECGWATECNESMDREQVGPLQQKEYIEQLLKWADTNEIIVFLFEAFDEPWKGGDAENEPEKHWGIYDVKRNRKW